ncbi:hypothetical protein Glove_230g18 [Diversispora epigaea]|uniref:Uncharacterized protein n=1 Tax=Diversispora epigaea TaxID=1348612 RepID=A0A397IFL5_9GLOM|nr:hypothetical protein Glove_230g18 [Diversispora epigaea]
MLNKCCCCIDLRTGTLILAGFGTLSCMVNAYRFLKMEEELGINYVRLFRYYLLAAFANIAGLYGVIKKNAYFVKTYSIFYWAQLVVGFFLAIAFSVLAFYFDKDICKEIVESKPPDVELDLEQCLEMYGRAAVAIVVLLGITCLINLHFCMAVWAYYKELKNENQYESIPENGINDYYTSVPNPSVSLPQSYESVPQDDFRKSHIPEH